MYGNASSFPIKTCLIAFGVMLVGICATSCIPGRKAKIEKARIHFSSIRDTRIQEVFEFYEDIQAHCVRLGSSQETLAMYNVIRNDIRAKDADLEGAFDVSTDVYKEFCNSNNFLSDYLETCGFYDIFLIDYETGQVLYTVMKEGDLGINLKHGSYADCGLAECYKQVVSTHEPYLTDIADYAPVPGYYAQFFGSPLLEDGEVIGVLVIKVPTLKLDEIVQNANGMGETGETYLVGADHLMRTDSRLALEYASYHTALDQAANQETVKKALAGEMGFDPDAVDFDGERVVAAYGFIDLPHGPRWAIVTEMFTAEIISTSLSFQQRKMP